MDISTLNLLNLFRKEKKISQKMAGRPISLQIMGAPMLTSPHFDPNIAVFWAHSLYEVFFPIDTCADRACNVPYIKVDDNGNEIEYTPAEKAFIRNPTQITTFTQFLYKYAFNLLASGNVYVHFLRNGGNIAYANALNSDFVMPNYNGKDGGIILSKDNNITNFNYLNYTIDKKDVYYSCYLPETFDNELKKGQAPLSIVAHNIDLLLSVYTARMNIYENNGIAGIITKKATNENQFEMALDPVTQKTISDELLNEYNIARLNNIKAISSVPLEFVKTLATIQELEPFREVQADAIAIAAVYGVKKELLGRETDTTFNNQRDAQRFLWQDTIKSLCYDISEMLEALFVLPANQYIIPDFTKIEVLQDDELTRTEILEKKINLLTSLQTEGNEKFSEKINNLVNEL